MKKNTKAGDPRLSDRKYSVFFSYYFTTVLLYRNLNLTLVPSVWRPRRDRSPGRDKGPTLLVLHCTETRSISGSNSK